MKTCDISRAEFLGNAKPLSVEFGGRSEVASVKEFSTGSLGWNVNGKATLMVGGKPVLCQVGMNITVIGSKEAK